MTQISPVLPNIWLRSNLSSAQMNEKIIEMLPVRRGLDFPACIDKIGPILSHSGCIAKTRYGYILIEYMGTGQVFVSPCNTYKPGEFVFQYRKFHFIHDSLTPQVPNPSVTLKQFVNTMILYMKDKPFNAATHSCHHARCWTMAKYGMVSHDPDSLKINTVFQAFKDYFNHDDPYVPHFLS